MPLFTPIDGGENPYRRIYAHSAASGPLPGCAFNIEGKWLDFNQPRFLAGLGTAYNGTAYRPLPGYRPVAHGYSLRHDGVLDVVERTAIDKMAVWCLTDSPAADPVIALFNHAAYLPGTAKAHDYPNEVMLITGAPPGLKAARAFRNHAPLLRRNSDYTFDLTPTTVFTGLLDVSAKASWTAWQATANTPVFQVLASDANPVVSIGASDEVPGVSYRQFGLHAPSKDISLIQTYDIGTKTPIGDVIPARLASGSAGSGPSTFTDDPDQVWDIQNGTEIELNVGFPLETASNEVGADTRVFIAIPAIASSGFTSAKFQMLGTYADPITKETAEATGATDEITVDGISSPTDAAGAAATQYLYVEWDKQYVSANHYRYDENNSNSHKYPRVKFVNSGGATPTRFLAFRAGKKYRRDDAVSRCQIAYCWEKRDGDYRVRSGHSGAYELFPTEVPKNHQIRTSAYFPPLESEAPTHMCLAVRAFNVGIKQDLDENDGISAGFTVTRTIPIRETNEASNLWSTNTGYPNHDIQISKAVIYNTLDSEEIGALNDVIPGGLLAVGGCYGATQMGAYCLFYGFPAFNLEEVTFTKGSDLVESSTDDFAGWFINRRLSFQGKLYNVRRVQVERASIGAELRITEDYGGETATDQAFLAADLSTIRITTGPNLYAENSPVAYSIPVPGEEITSIISTGEFSAVISCASGNVYELQIIPNASDLFRENVAALNYRLERENQGAGAAGPQSTAFVENLYAVDNGRGISSGINPTNLQDFTSPNNFRLFTELFNKARADARNLSYDYLKRHLLLSNVNVIRPSYPGLLEYGAVFDMQNNGALSLLYPWCGGASGVTRIPRPQTSAFRNNGLTRTQWAHGPIVMFVDVSTVGTGPISGVTQAGPHIVVYDTRANVWSGIYVGENNDPDLAPNDTSQMAPIEAPDDYPAPGTHSTIQTADGKIVCVFGAQANLGGESPVMVRLARAANGTWAIDDFAVQAGGFPPVYALAPGRDGSFYALRRRTPDNDDRMSIVHFDNDSVRLPYAPGVGGRQAVLALGTNDAFKWDEHDNDNKIIPALLHGPSGELIVFGYVHTATVSDATAGGGNTGGGTVTSIAADDSAPTETWILTCTATAANGGTFSVEGSVSGSQSDATVGTPYDNGIVSFTINDGSPDFATDDTFTFTRTRNGVLSIRRIDPETLQAIEDDFEVTFTDGGSNLTSTPGVNAPPRGPIAMAVNRHNEIFITERNGTNGTGTFPKVSLHRYRFPDWGYTAATSSASTVVSSVSSRITPEGRICLMVDQRQQTWVAYDKDMGSGRIGFEVNIYAENDAPIWGPIAFERSGYHRRLQSMVMAGNFAWYLVKDTPTGGGADEFRLIKAIGVWTNTSGDPTGDGRQDILTGGGSPQTEDSVGDNSVFFDLGTTIAGAGGAITYATCDTQMDRATPHVDQANATAMLGHYGLGAI